MPPQLALLPSDRRIGDKLIDKTNEWRNIFLLSHEIFLNFLNLNHDFLGKYEVVKFKKKKPQSTNEKTCNLNGFSDLICGITFSYHIK